MAETTDIALPKKKTISYSQYSSWVKCARRWYIDMVINKRVFEDSIHTVFGTSMHDVLQAYVKTLYTSGLVAAESLNTFEDFKARFLSLLKEKNVQCSVEDIESFVFDGENIIRAFLKYSIRNKHFPANKYEFIGIEVQIRMDVLNNASLVGFIDLVLRDKTTGRYKILDFKTSTMEWGNSQKNDFTKTDQLLMYKAMYSQHYSVPLNSIDVEFFILKRKLYENMPFPQSHIQVFAPPATTQKVVDTVKSFTEFVNSVFLSDGSYNQNIDAYPKIPGDQKKNCKKCPHYKKECDGKLKLK